MITQKQISLVKRTWRALRDLDPERLGDLFYSKLFIDHPKLRKLFPKDLSGQQQKLITTLDSMIMQLDRMHDQEQEVIALAHRHVQYGVQAKHYGYVGAALLWTLENSLGSDWTPDVAEAWTAYYTTLSASMIKATEDE